jgi:hypothetical protein
MTSTTLNIPDLSLTPYIIQPYIIDNKEFKFIYRWNIRAEMAFLSITYTLNESDIVIIRNVPIVMHCDLTRFANTDYWTYSLYLLYKNYFIDNVPKSLIYKQTNISSSYLLQIIKD